MTQDQQRIKELEAKLAEKDKDIDGIAQFIFATLRGLGVKSFQDIDQIGKVVLKEVPTIMFEATMQRAKLTQRFKHFEQARPLLEKYQHLIPKE